VQFVSSSYLHHSSRLFVFFWSKFLIMNYDCKEVSLSTVLANVEGSLVQKC